MGTRRVELTSMTFKLVCGMDEQKSFSKPGYRHFMCEDIRHIGRDITQNIIFGNGRVFLSQFALLDNSVKATRL